MLGLGSSMKGEEQLRGQMQSHVELVTKLGRQPTPTQLQAQVVVLTRMPGSQYPVGQTQEQSELGMRGEGQAGQLQAQLVVLRVPPFWQVLGHLQEQSESKTLGEVQGVAVEQLQTQRPSEVMM
jgi:hypothetical protein